jgi:hypothetical protein
LDVHLGRGGAGWDPPSAAQLVAGRPQRGDLALQMAATLPDCCAPSC